MPEPGDCHRYRECLKGITGEQIVHIRSDEELLEKGIESDLSRKYLLLQLARVREGRALVSMHRRPAHGVCKLAARICIKLPAHMFLDRHTASDDPHKEKAKASKSNPIHAAGKPLNFPK